MKKITATVLAIMLMVSLFTACSCTADPEPTKAPVSPTPMVDDKDDDMIPDIEDGIIEDDKEKDDIDDMDDHIDDMKDDVDKDMNDMENDLENDMDNASRIPNYDYSKMR